MAPHGGFPLPGLPAAAGGRGGWTSRLAPLMASQLTLVGRGETGPSLPLSGCRCAGGLLSHPRPTPSLVGPPPCGVASADGAGPPHSRPSKRDGVCISPLVTLCM